VTCQVTHAPGGHYVCWTHRKFLPWSEPFNPAAECCCANWRRLDELTVAAAEPAEVEP